MGFMSHMAEGIMADLWRDFWMHETRTGQQVAQLHDRYMMMMMMLLLLNYFPLLIADLLHRAESFLRRKA